MEPSASTRTTARIMEAFAGQTGLLPEGGAPPRRYLWTDAFAVCNYLDLYRSTGQARWLDLARRLIDQVHFVLGRHRGDDSRQGWISGLGEEEGKRRSTAGGLRIGKKMAERGTDERYDERLEWDRDGQYYHYLAKWMHALYRTATVTGRPAYLLQAADLAAASHRAFSYNAPDGGKLLYWKMSIDLSRPLVRAMGHHDPLDGLITCCEIQALARQYPESEAVALDAEIIDLAEMCAGGNWVTTDPLGLGGLLGDTWRLAQLLRLGPTAVPAELPAVLLEASLPGLAYLSRDSALRLPAAYRLAFRELGLAIGLQAVPRLEALFAADGEFFGKSSRLVALLGEFRPYLPLGGEIVRFWLREENQENAGWADHRDINMVMLATGLSPGGYLDLE